MGCGTRLADGGADVPFRHPTPDARRPRAALHLVAGTALKRGGTATAGDASAAADAAAGDAPRPSRRDAPPPSAFVAPVWAYPDGDGAGAVWPGPADAWTSLGVAWIEASMRFWLGATGFAGAFAPHPFAAMLRACPFSPWTAAFLPAVAAQVLIDERSRTRGALVPMGARPAP